MFIDVYSRKNTNERNCSKQTITKYILRLKSYIVFNCQFYVKIERDNDKMKNFDDENFDIVQSCYSH